MSTKRPISIIKFANNIVPVEEGGPRPETILSGKPASRTWNHYESADGKFFSGIWEADRGSWTIEYEEDELCHILSGRSRLTDEDGHVTEVKAGDGFVIPAGFKGIWEVIEPTRKHYAIYLP